jgi:hypothetical protein
MQCDIGVRTCEKAETGRIALTQGNLLGLPNHGVEKEVDRGTSSSMTTVSI